MDQQMAIDRILETENLTDGLQDDDADWLINWGISQVPALGQSLLADDESAGERLNQLMDVMRKLNRIASEREARPAEDLASEVSAFATQYAAVFGSPIGHGLLPVAPIEPQIDQIKAMSPRETMEHLIKLASGFY